MTPQIDILVVEDNPNDSRLVKRALQKTDFSPCCPVCFLR